MPSHLTNSHLVLADQVAVHLTVHTIIHSMRSVHVIHIIHVIHINHIIRHLTAHLIAHLVI